MAEERTRRRLAAILAADVVGFSRLARLRRARRVEVLQPIVTKHSGRVVKVMGDGVLVEFASAVDAVSCAVELQEAMGAANSEVPESGRIVLRIGISLGDVLVEGNDLYGDGVNVAARLEALTEAGGILVSHAVVEHVDHKLPVRFHDQGERTLKNISRPIRVYRVDWKAVPASPTRQLSPSQLELPDKTSIAVLPFINMSSDAEQEFFADGLAEDLITDLSRVPGLLVIARNSSFVTRSLYQQFEAIISRFVFAQVGEEPDWSKLHVMHAWGGSDRAGVYREAMSKTDSPYRDFNTAARLFGYELAFDGACKEALAALGDEHLDLYDMMLIDEAQDLPVSFFQLVYRMTRDPKRIVWAYDDLQNLGDFHMPSEVELFGLDSKGRPLASLRNETDQPLQDIVLPRCYRNPPWTLVTAHGVAFGVKREPMVQMFPDPNLWLRLGYRVDSGELGYDQDVVFERDPMSVPEFFSRLLTPADSLQTSTHASAAEQYAWVATTVKQLIDEDELQHSDFLIVMPDVRRSRATSGYLLSALRAVGLQGHVPGQTSSRDEVFRDGSIAITHIYRAKGNEAPAVFVVDAQYCEAPYGIKTRRNILFTAITRSRAWTFVTGVGDGMASIEREIQAIRAADYHLAFHYPSRNQIEQLAVSADKTQEGPPLIADGFDELRVALKNVRRVPWDRLPADLKQDLKDVYGQGT